jgi:hypothetical protein
LLRLLLSFCKYKFHFFNFFFFHFLLYQITKKIENGSTAVTLSCSVISAFDYNDCKWQKSNKRLSNGVDLHWISSSWNSHGRGSPLLKNHITFYLLSFLLISFLSLYFLLLSFVIQTHPKCLLKSLQCAVL